MPVKSGKTVGQLSVDELKDLIGRVVEEKLEKRLLDYTVDEDGFRISARRDEEDDLSFKPGFEKGLRRATKDAKTGRVKKLGVIPSK